jgi:hypothetical protein
MDGETIAKATFFAGIAPFLLAGVIGYFAWEATQKVRDIIDRARENEPAIMPQHETLEI